MQVNIDRKNPLKRRLWTRHPVPCIAAMLVLMTSLFLQLSCEDPIDQLSINDPLLVAGGGSSGAIYLSDDGKTWTQVYDFAGYSINHSAYGNNGFIVGGANPSANGFIGQSDDGYSWNEVFSGGDTIMGGAYFNKAYYVAGNNFIIRSSNGTDWDPPLALTGTLFCITFGNDVYISAGISALYRSANGSTWELVLSPAGYTFYDALYARGKFILVGNDVSGGSINEFVDGTGLSANRITVTNPVLHGITYGNRYFVAVGDSSRVWRSADGNSWEYVDVPWAGVTIYDVVYANGLFVAGTSTAGIIYSEDDGLTWTAASLTNGTFPSISTICRRP